MQGKEEGKGDTEADSGLDETEVKHCIKLSILHIVILVASKCLHLKFLAPACVAISTNPACMF